MIRSAVNAAREALLAQPRHVALTLAYSFVAGGLAASLIAKALVPDSLPVGYLTPIVLAGPVVGVLLGWSALRTLPRLRW